MLRLFQRLFSKKVHEPKGFDTVNIDVIQKVELRIEGAQFFVYEPSYLTRLEILNANANDIPSIILMNCVRDSAGNRMSKEQADNMPDEYSDLFINAFSQFLNA